MVYEPGMDLLSSGDFTGALLWALTESPGLQYGVFFIFLGVVIASLVHTQTKDFSITGLVWIVYLAAVGSVIPYGVAPYFMLLIGVSIAVLIIKVMLK